MLRREYRAKYRENPEKYFLDNILRDEPPEGSFPVCGIANIDDWDALRNHPVWKQLVEKEGTARLQVSTTLGRIEAKVARQLIARAYLNTYLVSLFLAPLAPDDLNRLADLPDRLDKIVGG